MLDLAAVLDAFGRVVELDTPCPACGISPELRAITERKRAMDLAFEACDAHLKRCARCRGWGGPYCAEMERLREAHFKAWQAYFGQPEGEWTPWGL